MLEGDISAPILYIDTSDVHEGALDELKRASAELADFVERNEPWLLSYNVFFSDDDRRMSVVHLHIDPQSLDRHLEVAGPRFARFADLLTISSLHIYGEPSEKALKQLRDKVGLLGSGQVAVHPLHAGFGRF
jgi:hypothetical protein